MKPKAILNECMIDLCFLEGFNSQIKNNEDEFISELGKTNLRKILNIKVRIQELINK